MHSYKAKKYKVISREASHSPVSHKIIVIKYVGEMTQTNVRRNKKNNLSKLRLLLTQLWAPYSCACMRQCV